MQAAGDAEATPIGVEAPGSLAINDTYIQEPGAGISPTGNAQSAQADISQLPHVGSLPTQLKKRRSRNIPKEAVVSQADNSPNTSAVVMAASSKLTLNPASRAVM